MALLLGGVIMWIVDTWSTRYEPNTIHVEEIGLRQALWIGICQSLSAIFPGHVAIDVDHCGGTDWRAWTGRRRSNSASCSRFPPCWQPRHMTFGKRCCITARPCRGGAAAGSAARRVRLHVVMNAQIVDCAGDRVRGFVHRGVWRGGVVSGTGCASMDSRSSRSIGSCSELRC